MLILKNTWLEWIESRFVHPRDKSAGHVRFVRDNLRQIIYDALKHFKKLYASAFYRKYGARIATMTTTTMAASRFLWRIEARPPIPSKRNKEENGDEEKEMDRPHSQQGCARKGSHDRHAIIENPSSHILGIEKSHPLSFGGREDTQREKKKGYCRRRLAIGPRRDLREPVNITDDTLLIWTPKMVPSWFSLSLFLLSLPHPRRTSRR